MVLNVSSIATPGLMYCADVFDSGTDENDDVARRAIKNILKSGQRKSEMDGLLQWLWMDE